MRAIAQLFSVVCYFAWNVWSFPTSQAPLVNNGGNNRSVSPQLFTELEELARIVDISYCVGLTGTGIQKPFECIGRCGEFQNFELIKTWNTGQLMSDSCGSIALSHPPAPPRIILAFRGTYSIANTVADLSTVPQDYVPYPGDEESPNYLERTTTLSAEASDKCDNCTVHSGFYRSWLNTRSVILPDVEAAIANYPNYTLTLVGHSLGGAVAGLASLDFIARGWRPRVTTFGEPRLGNSALMGYIDRRFHLDEDTATSANTTVYHRVTHVDDPVPLLPPKEWGFRMHASEIFITKPELSPDVSDLQFCDGNEDPGCIARGDTLVDVAVEDQELGIRSSSLVHGASGMWNIPPKYKLWQLFFAHRDYFWRLGVCVPGGDPHDWDRNYPQLGVDDSNEHNLEL